MNWFKKHLNWTYFIGIALSIVPFFLLLSVEESGGDGMLEFIVAIVVFVIAYGIGGWVLWQKGRSLWWLLLNAYFSPAWLSNNRTNNETNNGYEQERQKIIEESAFHLDDAQERLKIILGDSQYRKLIDEFGKDEAARALDRTNKGGYPDNLLKRHSAEEAYSKIRKNCAKK